MKFLASVFSIAVLGFYTGVAIGATETKTETKIPTIATWVIPFYLLSEKEGPFVNMIHKISELTGQEFKIKVLPPKRSMLYFKNSEMDVLFPAMDPNLPKEDVIKSIPYMQKRVYAFVMKGNTLPLSVKDLHGKRVGLVRGYAYPINVTNNENIKLEYSESAEVSMMKLKSNKIDIILDDINVAKNARINSNTLDAIFDENKPFALIDVYFAFQNTPEGGALAKKVSSAIQTMIDNKTITQYFQRQTK